MDDICTLRTVLERNLEYHREKIALIEGDRQYSFRAFADRTNAMGNALLDLGLEKGDRVAILGPNSIENAESYFSIPNAGLVLVMLNFRLAPKEALIVGKKADALDAETIKRYVRGEIAGYKVPKKVLFVESLPMSASGKILKFKLRKTFAD